MFNPREMYGFYRTFSEEVGFHINNFRKVETGGPPPIVGEALRVAGQQIYRVRVPSLISGVVASFDVSRGWGFIQYGNEERAFLHRSDCYGGWLPVIGDTVFFYTGWKKGRPRACWAKPCR